MRRFNVLLLIAAGMPLAGFASATQTQPVPLISITDPQPAQTYQTMTVHMTVHVSGDADGSTFSAVLNGADVTKLFIPSGACGVVGGCDKSADVPDTLLVNGDNLLSADVGGPDQSVGTARRKFTFSSPALTGPVQKLISAVAVASVDLAQWTDDAGKDVNDYQIVVGPGPEFPRTVYPASALGCSAGLNSMQVLVLGHGSLQPDATVAQGTNHPGQMCFGDAKSLAAFFKTVPAHDLVIAHSFTGLMPNLDTRAIGGTNYTVNGSPVPYFYSVIGVAGAPSGTAHETFASDYHTIVWDLVPLKGSLILDKHQNYDYVSSQYLEFSVIPNDPAYPGNGTSTITFSTSTPTVLHGTLPAGANGGFYAMVYDRGVGYVQDQQVVATNTGNPEQDYDAVRYLAAYLTRWSSQNFVFLTSIGMPFSSTTPNVAPLFDAINALGGNAYVLQNLSQAVNGNMPYYTFIGCNDPNYIQAGKVVESSSAYDSTVSPTIAGLLARDRKNRWYMKDEFSLLANAPKANLTPQATWPWEEVGFQQPQDWPAWTAGQLLAYQDLVAIDKPYGSLRTALGCADGVTCPPVRSRYTDNIGGSGAPSGFLTFSYSTLQYVPGRGYTADDFNAVVKQLAVEQGYLNNVYNLYSKFRDITHEQTGNFEAQLTSVAQNIDSTVRSNAVLDVDTLSKAATVAGLMSAIPAIGPAFGAASSVMSAAVALTPSPSGVPEKLTVTLNELLQQNRVLNTKVADATDLMFGAIVNDWAKLQTIGGGYGAQIAPWYLSRDAAGSNVPRAAVPFLALGAKRNFYRQLLPTKYSLDLWLGITQTQPSKIGREVPQPGFPGPGCKSFYASAPADSWLTYQDIPYPTLNDVYVITQTYKEEYWWPYRYNLLSFPSSGLLNDLFSAPVVNNTLSGGAGFDKFSIFRTNGGPLSPRAGDYQSNCTLN